MKFFNRPHHYCVTALPSKTNTTANIGVKCFVSLTKLISIILKWCAVAQAKFHVFVDPGAKVNSSYYCNIVLEKGLLPNIRAICRHYRWTLQQHGAPAHTARTTMDYLKKSTSPSLNLTCGLQIALVLILWITLFGVLISNESTTNNKSRRWKNWSER